MINLNKTGTLLLTIFIAAALLRVTLNIVREKVFFNGPFLLFDEESHYQKLDCDAMWYYSTARAFLKGKGVSSADRNWSNEKCFVDYRPWVNIKKLNGKYFAHKAVSPFYPLFLALCFYIGGANTLSYFIPQVVLASLTCIFIYLLAEELFDRRVGAAAALAVAFYPDLIFWTYKLRSETLFIFLITLGFWLLVRGNSRGNISLILLSAVNFGLAALTRITFIPFIPILFLWQLLVPGENIRRSLAISLLVVLVIILVVLPWCVRNLIVFDSFSAFSDEAYAFLFQKGPYEIEKANYYFRSSNCLGGRIIGFITDHPKEYLLSSLRRLATFWSPYTPLMKKGAKVYKALSWLIIFPLGFWGMIASRRSWRKSGVTVAFIIYCSVFHAASFIDHGLVYRYPIQPFICIFTAYGFWIVYGKLSARRGTA